MGNACEPNSSRGSPGYPLSAANEAQAAAASATTDEIPITQTRIGAEPAQHTKDQREEFATTEDEDGEGDENDEDDDDDEIEAVFEEDGVDITCPPVAIPRPKPGTSLPTWLRLILKQDFDGVVHEANILAAYHSLFPAPHISNDLLIRMLGQVFDVAEPYTGDYKCWIVGLRWINASEAADLFEAGYEAADAVGRRWKVQSDAKRMMEGLAKMSGGELPELHSKRGEVSAAQVQELGNNKPAGTKEEEPLPPPRDLNVELKELKEFGPYNEIVFWLRQTIELDLDSYVDSVDLEYAHRLKSFGSWHRAHDAEVDRWILAKIALEVFEGTEDFDAGWPLIVGIKWREIERPVFSGSIRLPDATQEFRKSAHKLLHIPDPERTKLWLQTIFQIGIGATSSLPSLWDFYREVFRRWCDTHSHLSKEDILQTITKTFQGVRAVEVSEGFHVMLGMHLRKESVLIEEILTLRQKRDLRRLQQAGQIDPPCSLFAKKLLNGPLLMRPRRGKNGEILHGSFVWRTRRRGGDLETGKQAPFGDEEPGFPGVSMKRAQQKYKRELEEYEKQMEETYPEGCPPETSPLPPPGPPSRLPAPPRGLALKAGYAYADKYQVD